MRRFLLFPTMLLLAGFMLVLGGCKKDSSNPSSPGTGGGGSQPAMTATVTIANFAFSPSTVTVAKGATITWTNNDNVAHTATSDANAWDTGSIAKGQSKTVTFANAGTFPYHCSVHPMMTATVIVQ